MKDEKLHMKLMLAYVTDALEDPAEQKEVQNWILKRGEFVTLRNLLQCFAGDRQTEIKLRESRTSLAIPRDVGLTEKVRPLFKQQNNEEREYFYYQTAPLPMYQGDSFLYMFLQTEDRRIVLMKARLGKTIEYSCTNVYDIYQENNPQFFFDHLLELMTVHAAQEEPLPIDELHRASNYLVPLIQEIEDLDNSMLLLVLEQLFKERNEQYGEIRLSFVQKREDRLLLEIGEHSFYLGFYKAVYEPERDKKSVRLSPRKEMSDVIGSIVTVRNKEKPEATCMVFFHCPDGDDLPAGQITLPLELDDNGMFKFKYEKLPDDPLIRHKHEYPIIIRKNRNKDKDKNLQIDDEGVKIEFLPIEDVDFRSIGWL